MRWMCALLDGWLSISDSFNWWNEYFGFAVQCVPSNPVILPRAGEGEYDSTRSHLRMTASNHQCKPKTTSHLPVSPVIDSYS